MKQSTQVPNIIFDKYLPELKESELKILLIVIRQTIGWIDKQTNSRKERDWISRSQFMHKTGLSRKVVSNAIQTLLNKGLINITCQSGNNLNSTIDRKGKRFLFYSLGYILPSTGVKYDPSPGYNFTHNKRNSTKESITKLRMNRPVHIAEVLKQYRYGIA